jgi:hypothetical protein
MNSAMYGMVGKLNSKTALNPNKPLAYSYIEYRLGGTGTALDPVKIEESGFVHGIEPQFPGPPGQRLIAVLHVHEIRYQTARGCSSVFTSPT